MARDTELRHPNIGPDGNLVQVSNCRACVHWAYAGTVFDRRHGRAGLPELVGGCGKKYANFPTRKDCPDYEREPGSDDA